MTTLNAQAIQSAALAIVDEEGADKLTMRRVASRLGVEAPSLYHHVQGKDALLDSIVDALLAQVHMPTQDTPPAVATHRFAAALREVLAAHPNAVRLIGARPSRSLRLLDEQAGPLVNNLEAAGLSSAQAMDLLRTTMVFVLGHAEVLDGSNSISAADADAWFRHGLDAIRSGFGILGPTELMDTLDLEIEPEGLQAREVAQDLDAAGMADVDSDAGAAGVDTAGPQDEGTDLAPTEEAPAQAPAAEVPAAEIPAAEVPRPLAAEPARPSPAPAAPRPSSPPPRPAAPAPEPPRRGIAGRLLRRAGHLLGRDD